MRTMNHKDRQRLLRAHVPVAPLPDVPPVEPVPEAPEAAYLPAVPPRPYHPDSGPVLLARAALTLPETFTLTQLAVAAWQAHPRMFGMRGAEREHASDHRTRNHFYGARGALGRGWIRLVRGRLVLTPMGRKIAGGTSPAA